MENMMYFFSEDKKLVILVDKHGACIGPFREDEDKKGVYMCPIDEMAAKKIIKELSEALYTG